MSPRATTSRATAPAALGVVDVLVDQDFDLLDLPKGRLAAGLPLVLVSVADATRAWLGIGAVRTAAKLTSRQGATRHFQDMALLLFEGRGQPQRSLGVLARRDHDVDRLCLVAPSADAHPVATGG